MQSFHIDTPYVCIGPFDAAYSASLQLNKGNLPTAWSRPASADFPQGSTVLVHDVDVRLPVKTGNWRVGRLFNPHGIVCGVIYWHSEYASEKEDLHYAAQLLHRMEDLGASVICNVESESILHEGIRFIVRYSWDVIDRETDQLPKEFAEEFYSVFANGPQCFFVSPKIVQSQILPEVATRYEQWNAYVNSRIEQLKSEGKKESYPGELRFGVAYNREDATLASYAFPAYQTYQAKTDEEKGEGGASVCFPNQEYMYGRAWMDTTNTDPSKPVCKAFCAYTYASAECFDYERVEEVPVCAALPAITIEEIRQSKNSMTQAILKHLTTYTNEQLAIVMQGVSGPVCNMLLHDATAYAPTVFERCCTNGLIPWTVDIYEKLLSILAMSAQASSFGNNNPQYNVEALVLMVLNAVPYSIVQASISTAQAAFTRTNQAIAEKTYDFRSFGRPGASHLGSFLQYPTIVRKFLELGHPINGTLAESMDYGSWYRTPFATAAYEGFADTVQVFLEHGGDVNESVEGDRWNVIAYAAASGQESILSLFRYHVPNHPIWSATNLPIHPKELPRFNLFTNKEESNPDVEKLGTIDMIYEEAKRAREEMEAKLAARQSVFGGGFGLGSGGGGASIGIGGTAVAAFSSVFSFANNQLTEVVDGDENAEAEAEGEEVESEEGEENA
jgi:hypothetical protein